MKKSLLLAFFLFQLSLVNAQFGTATDFTVTDINGNEHNLYSILDSGKAVVLDCSATWCGPCWQVHEAKYLTDLYTEFGPAGKDLIEVIFYEADAGTNEADLNGTGNSTIGDWVTDVPYPIVNESPLQLNRFLYWPDGFPTINLIRPSDREIVADMWDFDLDQMSTAVENLLAAEGLLSVEEQILAKEIALYPNPASELINIDGNIDIKSMSITNILGQTVQVINSSARQIDISDLDKGEYFLRMSTTDDLIVNKAFTKI